MALNPQYETICSTFIQQFYALFDDPAQRANLATFYNEERSMLTFEGEQLFGRTKIMQKLQVRIGLLLFMQRSSAMFDFSEEQGTVVTNWTHVTVCIHLQHQVPVLKPGRQDVKHLQGVGLLLSRHTSDALLGYDCINERFLTAKFRTKIKDLNVICCYAPTKDSGENEKDTFYSQLQDILNSVKKGDISLVLGDFNAKVGTDSDLSAGVLGSFGIGSSNGNGEHLLQSLTFQKIAHSLTAVDPQPMFDGGILISVLGQLKTDDDPPHTFNQIFVLKPQTDTGSFYIEHDTFRLSLHSAT